MSIVSEFATEHTIEKVVVQIKKELEESRDKPEACSALKKLGRFSLTLFEYSTPQWVKEYSLIFKE